MAELIVDQPSVALAIYAHPDDADVGCGGTLARWAKAGTSVHLLVCTDGGRGTPDAGTDPVALAHARRDELSRAAEIIGLSSHHGLDLPDGELTDGDELRRELVAGGRRLKPDVVLGHDPTAVFFGQDYFNHRDHRTAGWALLDALAPAAALPLYFPEAGPAHQVTTVYLSGTLEPDVFVDVSDTIALKAAAVECHRSQFSGRDQWAGDAVRLRAEEEGRRAGVAFAEGYRRLRLGA
jgi:LmbE family N-acetylglucosaminyl deacetylase